MAVIAAAKIITNFTPNKLLTSRLVNSENSQRTKGYEFAFSEWTEKPFLMAWDCRFPHLTCPIPYSIY